MIDFFKELFAYNHQSNQKMIEIFLALSNKPSDKSLSLFSHILNSHHIWNGRIADPTSSFGVWQLQETNIFNQIAEENFAKSLRILEHVDLDQTTNYNTTKGLPFKNTVRDILFHVINHSTYHRA